MLAHGLANELVAIIHYAAVSEFRDGESMPLLTVPIKPATVLLVARVEGVDRKSFFAVAESQSGVDSFRFWDEPLVMPETDDPDVNVYDMRLIRHEDGWIYGLFCTERKDPKGDISAAVAQCG